MHETSSLKLTVQRERIFLLGFWDTTRGQFQIFFRRRGIQTRQSIFSFNFTFRFFILFWKLTLFSINLLFPRRASFAPPWTNLMGKYYSYGLSKITTNAKWVSLFSKFLYYKCKCMCFLILRLMEITPN